MSIPWKQALNYSFCFYKSWILALLFRSFWRLLSVWFELEWWWIAGVSASPLATGEDDLFEQFLACRAGTMWLQCVVTSSTPLLSLFLFCLVAETRFHFHRGQNKYWLPRQIADVIRILFRLLNVTLPLLWAPPSPVAWWRHKLCFPYCKSSKRSSTNKFANLMTGLAI